MKRPPNPNNGGSYRVVNGQLVAESAALVAAPVLRLGGPGLPVPPADAPAGPAATPTTPQRRNRNSRAASSSVREE